MECSDKLKQAGIDILISVIIPIYNVEQYLKQCLDSVINQTYRNLEIILVDDGSTDKSGLICDEYSQKDKRIKVIHKKNGGLSDARNAGLEIYTGDYVAFIDSDDYVDTEYIKELYRLIVKYNADISVCGFFQVHDRNIHTKQNDKISDELIGRKEMYKRIMLQQGTDAFACGKLYKKDIFYNVRYPVGELYEDVLIIDKIIEKCDAIGFTSYKGYYYFKRKGSITQGKMTEKHLACIKAAEALLKLVNKKYPDIEYAAIRKYIYANYHVLGLSVLSDKYDNISKQLKQNILKYKKFIFKSNYISKIKKIQTIFLIMGIPIYKIMWRLYCVVSNN